MSCGALMNDNAISLNPMEINDIYEITPLDLTLFPTPSITINLAPNRRYGMWVPYCRVWMHCLSSMMSGDHGGKLRKAQRIHTLFTKCMSGINRYTPCHPNSNHYPIPYTYPNP